MKKVSFTLIFLMVFALAHSSDWVPFDSFYKDLKKATNTESLVDTPVEVSGVVTDVMENHDVEAFGNVKYVVEIKKASDLYVNVGTDDDVVSIKDGDLVTAYGYYTNCLVIRTAAEDSSVWVIEAIKVNLRDGHIKK